jgi:nitrogen fixation/metabolism regulation signal transduction histidine kinase
LATLDSTQLGGSKFYLIGGIEITPSFLREFQHDTTEILVLQLPDKALSSSPQWAKQKRLAPLNSPAPATALPPMLDEEYSIGGFMLPVISDDASEQASFFLLHPKTELKQILYGINERIFIISGIGIIIAIALSVWRSRAVAKPLLRLAKSAGALSLEKLNVDFDVHSNDEVGVLNDALRRMARRLRQSRIELALAEQKTALVEIARQVNHDIKNGFIPIHYVMQHWMEVAETEGDKLLQVFNERKMTVLKSLDYLENLARNYSRLRPNVTLAEVHVNPLISDLMRMYQEVSPSSIEFQMQLDAGNPAVQADAVQLRRAFENILRNSLDAIGEAGVITVSTEMKEDRVYVTWVDSGGGIPENIRERIFFNYVTTKPEGAGLGLINVKHIVEDFGGSVSLQSYAGHGTTVRLIFPLPNGVAD